MRSIFGLLYLLVFSFCGIAALFILFHISRYALNRRFAFLAMILFVVVTAILLFTNALIFFSLPLDAVLPVAGNSSFLQ